MVAESIIKLRKHLDRQFTSEPDKSLSAFRMSLLTRDPVINFELHSIFVTRKVASARICHSLTNRFVSSVIGKEIVLASVRLAASGNAGG